MDQYQKLDALIMAEMRPEEGRGKLFKQLQADMEIAAETKRVATETNRDAFRVLDGRLQALKRQGKIRHGGPTIGWLKATP